MQENYEITRPKSEFTIAHYKESNNRLKDFENPIVKELISCKCCNSNEVKLIARKGSYQLLECSGCQFIFSYSEKIRTSYRNTSTDSTPVKASSSETREYLNRAIEWLPKKPLKILNIGYSDTGLLDLMKRKGHQTISYRDVNDFIANLDSHPHLSNKKFDVIITSKALNHIHDPKMIFSRIFDLLNEFGLHVLYMDMQSSAKDVSRKLHESEININLPFSMFRYKTIEKLFDNLGHDIVYRNPKMIMAKKGLSA